MFADDSFIASDIEPKLKSELGDCSKMRADQLEKLQNRAARIITRADYSVRSCDILKELYIGQRCVISGKYK